MSKLPKPSRQRLAELFLKTAGTPSPSRDERKVADFVVRFLEDIGLTVTEDGVAADVGGNTGNLWCTVGATSTEPHLALCAHIDTVKPSDEIEPFLDDQGVFRNRRSTILGGDDKSAVVALLHATELLLGWGSPFPAYECLFTVCEEQGLLGSRHMDEHLLRSPLGAVLDSSGPVGGIVVRAPSQNTFHATFRGFAAHAGVEPERGRSAIQAAARAIAAMQLGRVDEETSANVGVIHGGVATNIIPDLCQIDGECRSRDEEKLARFSGAMVDAMQTAAAQTGVDLDVNLVHEYRSFSLNARSAAVRLGRAAMEAIGMEPRLLTAGGGSDANVLNARGLPSINISCGMMRVHGPDEYLALDELEKLCALILQLIMLAPEFSPGEKTVLAGP